MRKLRLDLDSVTVDSFPMNPGEDGKNGTVEAHAPACTCNNSCLCPTAYYRCGTGPYTIYSCDYTANRSCGYE